MFSRIHPFKKKSVHEKSLSTGSLHPYEKYYICFTTIILGSFLMPTQKLAIIYNSFFFLTTLSCPYGPKLKIHVRKGWDPSVISTLWWCCSKQQTKEGKKIYVQEKRANLKSMLCTYYVLRFLISTNTINHHY